MSRTALTALLQDARARVGASDPDLARELDGYLNALRVGPLHPSAVSFLFLPTGPLQDLSIEDGWGDEFLALADRFDAAEATAGVTRGRTTCTLCDLAATTIDIDATGLRRGSFVSTLGLLLPDGPSDRLRAAVEAGDARALHAIDPELVPCFCPDCDRVYCGDHWTTRDVFDDDGYHDSVRGTCPSGHERLLED